MRDKEVKQDYRFMPEPNLPPLRMDLNGKSPKNPNVLGTIKRFFLEFLKLNFKSYTTVSPKDFKWEWKYSQLDLSRMKEHVLEFLRLDF